MGVLRRGRGKRLFSQTPAERIQRHENLNGFKANMAFTGSAIDGTSGAVDNEGEQAVNAERAARLSARGKGSSSRSDRVGRRQRPESPEFQQVASIRDSDDSGRPQSPKGKGSPGPPDEAAFRAQEGPRPPTPPPGAGTQGPSRDFDGKQNAESNNNNGGQHSNQDQGPSGGQDPNRGQSQNQGKGSFNQAGGPRPNQKADSQSPGQTQNQGSNFDPPGASRPNQNVGGQNSGQNQGNNGSGNQGQNQGNNSNGNNGQNQGKTGKGNQNPNAKQNENGNQNSDKPTETRPPKQTPTSDPATNTIASSSPGQTTETQAQPTEAPSGPPPPQPPSQPSPSSAQPPQQPPQSPAITPPVPMPSTSSESPATTSPLTSASTFSTETQVPTNLPPTSIAIGQPVAALEPTTSQTPEVVNQVPSQSGASSQGVTPGAIAGIVVGSVSVLLIVAAMVMLFKKLKRHGALSFVTQRRTSQRGMTDESGSENRLSRTDMNASLVEKVAPVAGTLEEQEVVAPWTDQDEVQQPPSVAQRLSRYSPWSSKGRAVSRRVDQEDQFRMSTASNPFYLQDEVLPTAPRVPSLPVRAAQIDLVQQAEPAESKDCPFQRLQDRLRLHNSSDPRPCRLVPKQTAVDRGSVSTVSSSNTYPSPHTSSRFSFGLLLQPSLELFKFSDIRASLGGRGSGWSLWFKEDDASNGKQIYPDMETK